LKSAAFTHVHSIRLASGHEALVARALTPNGGAGFGFSMRLDATEARHMAEWDAGLRKERPRVEPAIGHPWETSWVAGEKPDWKLEPAFAQIRWLPEEDPHDHFQAP
jgi:hypothetical protein